MASTIWKNLATKQIVLAMGTSTVQKRFADGTRRLLQGRYLSEICDRARCLPIADN
ncbi:MAG: hypothetical protein AB4352_06740 [Hormoscilla sp.]